MNTTTRVFHSTYIEGAIIGSCLFILLPHSWKRLLKNMEIVSSMIFSEEILNQGLTTSAQCRPSVATPAVLLKESNSEPWLLRLLKIFHLDLIFVTCHQTLKSSRVVIKKIYKSQIIWKSLLNFRSAFEPKLAIQPRHLKEAGSVK